MRDDQGRPLRYISQVLDVSAGVADRTRLEEATARSERERRLTDAIVDTTATGLALLDSSGHYERMSRRHADFLALAFPGGHHGWAGQLGDVYDADGRTLLGRDDMPSIRALRDGPFDDVRIWVGADPALRRALSVSARSVLDEDGSTIGVVLDYSDVTELVRSLDARDQFVAAVSHELRTPLTSVLSHLELLLDSPEEHSPDTLRGLGVAHRNGLRLRRLVSDLLASAQERAGGLLLDRAVVDVVALVREAVEAADPTARHREVRLEATGAVVALADVDALRIRQVLDNLIANAVSYTDAGGRVEVSVAEQDGDLVLVVHDTGIGIVPEHLDRVFEPFFRTAAAKAQSAPGLGLGLGVVKVVVDAHHGRTAVTSTPGLGTRVEVRVPVRRT
jgi:signal transduction histidine kinase